MEDYYYDDFDEEDVLEIEREDYWSYVMQERLIEGVDFQHPGLW